MRLKGNGELTSRRHSDPATVTREVTVQQNPFEEEYETFRRQAYAQYKQFRQQAIREYADFVRQAWQEYGARPARPKPRHEDVVPVMVPEQVILRPMKSVPIKIDEVVLRMPEDELQPVPVFPEEKKEEQTRCIDFTFFGTPMRVRFSGDDQFSLQSTTPDGVADAFLQLASANYDNTLLDCLKLRQLHQLNDWAYLQMLDSLSHTCFSTNNEAVLLMAYLYQQSGYKMRLGVLDGQLAMLYATRHLVYGKRYYYINGEDYYLYDSESDRLSICEANYPKEQPLSLQIPTALMLAECPSEERTLQSARYPDFKFTVRVNKNLIDFYGTYPTSMVDDNFITRWGMYANTPLEAGVEQTLLSQIREKLKGLDKLEATERLLNWVQTAFVYEQDDKLWGADRAFFAEETLYYPFCDCEDRSILFSRLVRNLLNLPVVLVYYPNHLATAVCFGNEEVTGDYLVVDGRRFVVCDPTYIGGGFVGKTMPQMDNQIAKVLLLE